MSLVVATRDRLELLDTELRVYKTLNHEFTLVVCPSGSQELFGATSDGVVVVSIETSRRLRSVFVENPVRLAVSSNGEYFSCSTKRGHIQIHNAKTMKLLRTFSWSPDIYSMGFLGSSVMACRYLYNSPLRLYRPTGVVSVLPSVKSFAVSNSQTTIAYLDGRVIGLLDVSTKKRRETRTDQTTIVFSDDDTTLMTVDEFVVTFWTMELVVVSSFRLNTKSDRGIFSVYGTAIVFDDDGVSTVTADGKRKSRAYESILSVTTMAGNVLM
jgi:hypothetical protein